MRTIDADALEFSYFAHIENYSIHPEYSEDIVPDMVTEKENDNE